MATRCMVIPSTNFFSTAMLLVQMKYFKRDYKTRISDFNLSFRKTLNIVGLARLTFHALKPSITSKKSLQFQ